MTPGELLASAREVLESPADGINGLAGSVPAALLARQALEAALEEYWQMTAPGLERCTAAAQLVTLRFYLDTAVASAVSYAWCQLSRVCHYDGYDLAPTAAEMEHLLDIIDDLITATAQTATERTALIPP